MRIRSTVVAAAVALAIGMGALPEARGRQDAKASVAAMTINLNTATQAELEKLPGVGPAMAKAILEYRQKSGGFKKVEELMNVRGIGEKNFLKLKAQLSVGPAKADHAQQDPK